MATDFRENLYPGIRKNQLRIQNSGLVDITNPDYTQNSKA